MTGSFCIPSFLADLLCFLFKPFSSVEHSAPEDEYICPAAGFISGWPIGVELTAGLYLRDPAVSRDSASI